MPAFKTFVPVGVAEGEYGTSPYGQEAYGGNQSGTTYVLPDNEVGGDDPTKQLHWRVGEVEQRRAGVLLGARKFADRRVWVFHFTQLVVEDVQALLIFFRARIFKFIPDESQEETYFRVRWLGTEFAPSQDRGGPFTLSFAVEET